MTKLVDVSKLNQALVTYDRLLRTLPFNTLKEVATALSLNLMNLQGKHALINERRRAGGTQSYKEGKDFSYLTALLGYDASVIEPKDVVFITKENSKKYEDNELLVVGGQPVSNITKRHPLELRIVSSLVRSHAEDVIEQLFHAVRDDASVIPSGAFNGFFSKLNDLLSAGEINVARGNYYPTGVLSNPVSDSDTDAYEILVDFIASASSSLRSSKGGVPQLLASQGALSAARAAFRNKVKSHSYPTMEDMLKSLREDAFAPGLLISTHECLGSGSKLILQKVGNMDVAFNTQAASQFCQIRNIYEDPNDWQFWLQSGYDTRIRDWHEKVFRTNEQQNISVDMAGDDAKTGGIQIAIEGTESESAVASVTGVSGTRRDGYYFLSLAPGNYTVNFSGVSGYAAESAAVTVQAGRVAVATGTFKKEVVLTLAANNALYGAVTAAPAKEKYLEGDEVVLTATAETGYHFTKWDDENTDNPRTVTVPNANKTYTATFAQD